jgi:hypothetical protein
MGNVFLYAVLAVSAVPALIWLKAHWLEWLLLTVIAVFCDRHWHKP